MSLDQNWLEIDTHKIRQNIHTIMDSFNSPHTQLLVMVKANAYGHGLLEISKIASEEGARFLGVTNLEDAIKIRKSKIKTPILLLSCPGKEDIELLYRYKITPTIYDKKSTHYLVSYAKKINKKIAIHLKIETGLNRFGFNPEI